MHAIEHVLFYSESMTNPARIREVLTQMRAMGAGAVLCSVYEQDMLRLNMDVRRFFAIAREVGLRRYVSFGRHGNVFSGLLQVPSLFAYEHPHTLISPMPDASRPGAGEADGSGSFWNRMCCVNHPEFQRFMLDQLRAVLSACDPDGLLLDEPKSLSRTCACEHCVARRRQGESLQQAHLRTQVEFIESLCDLARHHHADLCTMIVVMADDEAVLDQLATIASLDVLGVEAYWINRGQSLDWLASWCPTTVGNLRARGKRVQVWANNFRVPAGWEESLAESYRILAHAHPDQVCSFWYWRGCDDPDRVMQATAHGISYSSEGVSER